MKLKVISLNLEHGGVRFDKIIEFLKEQNADVVLTQETYSCEDESVDRQYRSMQVMPELLGYEHVHFSAAYRDFDRTAGKGQRGNGIFSKYPLEGRDTIFFDGQYSEEYRDVPEQYAHCPRNLQHVVLHLPTGHVDVFNVQGVWDLDGENYSDKRQRMAQTIISQTKDLPKVIFAGDTNATPKNQAIIEIEKYLKSVFDNGELKTTFNMRVKTNPGYATAAVDMILTTPNISVVEKSCPDIDVSDHLPLVATLEI
jgi:endonuclease/exonuclease/phosphatase family metal-dependent hydrolase